MKKSPWRSLFLYVAIFTLILGIASFLIHLVRPGLISQSVLLMFVFFFIVTLAGLGLIIWKTGIYPESFAKYYFIVMTGRLILGISFVWAGLSIISENRIIFVGNFLVLYLLFLGFEIYYILAKFQAAIR